MAPAVVASKPLKKGVCFLLILKVFLGLIGGLCYFYVGVCYN